MSSSTVRICENNQVEIRRTFSPAFLLSMKYGKPRMIRAYEPGQPIMEIVPTSAIGQKLVAIGLVYQFTRLPSCPYCHGLMATSLSLRNYLQRSGFHPTAVLNECTACGTPLPTPLPLFEKVSPGKAISLVHTEGTA